MKIIRSLLVSVSILLAHTVHAGSDIEQGEKLYKTYCSACHGTTGGMDMSKRLAPPVFAVQMHYLGPYPEKTAFVTAVVDWLAEPDESKTLMPGAIRKFKLMPLIKVTRGDAEKIAAYIYAGGFESPAGFEEHYEEMHGKPPGSPGN